MPPDAQADLRGAVRAIVAAGTPGAHLSVSVAGGMRMDARAGHAQLFDDAGPCPVEMTARHAHDLGSVTKIAGTTAMLVALASSGELSVDDRVGRYLDGLPPALADATLRDLLAHRSGLWEWWPTYLATGDPIGTVARLPLRYPPRSGRHYSDLGFMLLGEVVRAVAGAPLPDAHRALVTGPAGTAELTYAAPPPGSPAAAGSRGDAIERRMVVTGKPYPVTADPSGFGRWRRHVLVGEVNDGNAFHSFGGAAGHAGLFGTATGLHALGGVLLASLAGEGPWRALPAFLAPGPDAGQLLGFRSWPCGQDGCAETVVGHTGFPGIGWGLLPRHRASVVLATNRLHVDGEPADFAPVWQDALAAAHRALHAAGASAAR